MGGIQKEAHGVNLQIALAMYRAKKNETCIRTELSTSDKVRSSLCFILEVSESNISEVDIAKRVDCVLLQGVYGPCAFFGVLQSRMPEQACHGLYICPGIEYVDSKRMSCKVIGQSHLEAALSAYLFRYLVATAVARNGKNMTVPCKSLVFLYDTLGNVQQTDI